MARAGSYRGKLLEELKSLSEDRIKALADFASYLRERRMGSNGRDSGQCRDGSTD
jgi:hypothetical protein